MLPVLRVYDAAMGWVSESQDWQPLTGDRMIIIVGNNRPLPTPPLPEASPQCTASSSYHLAVGFRVQICVLLLIQLTPLLFSACGIRGEIHIPPPPSLLSPSPS